MPIQRRELDKPQIPGAASIAALYGGVAFIWVLVSDATLVAAIADPDGSRLASTLKGISFVAATAALLYFLVRRLALRQVAAFHRERQHAQTLTLCLLGDQKSDELPVHEGPLHA